MFVVLQHLSKTNHFIHEVSDNALPRAWKAATLHSLPACLLSSLNSRGLPRKPHGFMFYLSACEQSAEMTCKTCLNVMQCSRLLSWLREFAENLLGQMKLHIFIISTLRSLLWSTPHSWKRSQYYLKVCKETVSCYLNYAGLSISVMWMMFSNAFKTLSQFSAPFSTKTFLKSLLIEIQGFDFSSSICHWGLLNSCQVHLCLGPAPFWKLRKMSSESNIVHLIFPSFNLEIGLIILFYSI